MWATVVLAGLLLLTSAILLVWQFRGKPAASDGVPDARTIRFLLRQHRRRVLVGVLVGFVGLAFVGSVWTRTPLIAATYWMCVAIVVGWIAALAVADLSSSRRHFRRLYAEHLSAQAVLRAELDRLRRHRGNGRKEKGTVSQDGPHEAAP
jgi:hypothetical protein